MFRAPKLFGTDSFRLTLEYGHVSDERRPCSPTQASLLQPAARLEFDWSSDESEARVVERLAQRQADLLASTTCERVVLQLQPEAIPNAAYFPEQQLCVSLTVACTPPVLRCIQFARTSGSGAPPDSLLAALLHQLDLPSCWRLRGAEGLGNFWASRVQDPALSWRSLATLNLSSCGLSSLPAEVGLLAGLQVLRLTSNKLTTLPPAIGSLRQLQVLAADHNQLTSIPVELRHCTALQELHLEGNKLVNVLLDLAPLASLRSLQLFGNPLDYLPELAPATSLRSLSLANVRILADTRYTRWEVEVATPSGSAYANIISRGHKLAPLFGLVFRRSSIQHPLLAGALARLCEDPSNCELLLREEVALQQVVAMAMSADPLVAAQAVAVLQALGELPGAARKLIRHNAVRAIMLLIASDDQESQLGGLTVLANLAAGAEEGDRGDRLVPTQLLDRLLHLARHGASEEVRCAALEALGNSAFDAVARRRYLQSPGLMHLLVDLASGHDPAESDEPGPGGKPAVGAATAAVGAEAAAAKRAAAGGLTPKAAAGGMKAGGKAAMSQLRCHAIRLLAILGQNEQVRIALRQPAIRGRGLRILAMDGGGMKGMAMVEILRQIERRAGRPIWELFDVIGGTSTGAMVAVAIGLLRMSLDECQDIYTSLGNKVFHQSPVVQEDAGWKDSLYRLYSTSTSNMKVAVYGFKHDAGPYERLLKEFCCMKPLGCISDRLIDTAVMGGPKVFAVATLASKRPAAPFTFRNYELPFEVAPLAEQLRACQGSCRHFVWQAVRASSAAPYYLEDFLCGSERFQDGAATANNPALIALQQGLLLYPDLPIDVLVSLGCGSEPVGDRSKGLSSMMDTGTVLVESACSVDRVDEALATLLPLVPGIKYYRFNPVDVRCGMELDEVSPEVWAKLMAATTEYCTSTPVAAAFDQLSQLLGSKGSSSSSMGGSGESRSPVRRPQQQPAAGKLGPSSAGGGSLGAAKGPRDLGIGAHRAQPTAAAAAAGSLMGPSPHGLLGPAAAGLGTLPQQQQQHQQHHHQQQLPGVAAALNEPPPTHAAALHRAGQRAQPAAAGAAAADSAQPAGAAAPERGYASPPAAPSVAAGGAPGIPTSPPRVLHIPSLDQDSSPAAQQQGTAAAPPPAADVAGLALSEVGPNPYGAAAGGLLAPPLAPAPHVLGSPPAGAAAGAGEQATSPEAAGEQQQQQQQGEQQGEHLGPMLGRRAGLLLLEAPRQLPGVSLTPQQLVAQGLPGGYIEAVAAALAEHIDPSVLVRCDLGTSSSSSEEGAADQAAGVQPQQQQHGQQQQQAWLTYHQQLLKGVSLPGRRGSSTSLAGDAAATPEAGTAGPAPAQQQQQHGEVGSSGRRSTLTISTAPPPLQAMAADPGAAARPSGDGAAAAAAAATSTTGAAAAAAAAAEEDNKAPSSWLGMLFPWQASGTGSASGTPSPSAAAVAAAAAGGAAGGTPLKEVPGSRSSSSNRVMDMLTAQQQGSAASSRTSSPLRSPPYHLPRRLAAGALAASPLSPSAAAGAAGGGGGSGGGIAPAAGRQQSLGSGSWGQLLPPLEAKAPTAAAGEAEGALSPAAAASGSGGFGGMLKRGLGYLTGDEPEQDRSPPGVEAAAAAAGMALAVRVSHQEDPNHHHHQHQHHHQHHHQQQQQQWDQGYSGSGHKAAAAAGPAASPAFASSSSMAQREPGYVRAVRSAMAAGGGHVGVVHLCLHCLQEEEEEGLVTCWRQQLQALVEPGYEACQLAASLGSEPGTPLSQLLLPPGAPELLPTVDGGLVRVLSQQQVRCPAGLPAAVAPLAPAAAAAIGLRRRAMGSSLGGTSFSHWGSGQQPLQVGAAAPVTTTSSSSSMVTSWLLHRLQPDASRLLGEQGLYLLLPLLQQQLVVSSGWLPPELMRAMLQGGARGVVVPMDPQLLDAVDPRAVARFFLAFYRQLYAGAGAGEALLLAGREVPEVGEDAYACYQL